MHRIFIKLIIESKLEFVVPLSEAIRVICSTVVDDEILLYDIKLCLDEATTNVIKHAYHCKPENTVEVSVTIDEGCLVFQIVDSGDRVPMFTPKKELDYNVNDIDSLPESGMGLFLMHRIMDEVSFSHRDKKNILTMKKNYTKRFN